MRPLDDREWLEQIRVDMLGRSLADYDHATSLLDTLDVSEDLSELNGILGDRIHQSGGTIEAVEDLVRRDEQLAALLASLGIDKTDDPISILRMFLPVD